MFRELKWTSLLLVVLLTVSLLFPVMASATTIQGTNLKELRQTFDRHDAAGNGGNWYKNANNENATLAWHESRVLESYLRMFEATSDTYYLDKFIDHADSVLASRDSVRGVKDYRGLSLPAWRSLRYSLDKKPYIAAVHTGMISYPLAEFARIVKSHPGLESYGAKAAEYLQAAKDAVAVHDDEWVESGNKGWYIIPKGAPIWSDGVNLPFNQYAALARTQLAIYLTTGENKYLDKVEKMARNLKEHLIYKQSTDCYVWNYTFGTAYEGWTASDNVSTNTPDYPKGIKSVEDISHGAIEAAFMYEAYKAGIVFTEQDMQRTGNTIEKNLIKPDGSIAKYIDGRGTAGSQTQKISLYLQYHKYAPSLMDVTQKINHNGSSATLELALYIKAVAEKQGLIGNPASPDKGNETTPADNPPAGDIDTNNNTTPPVEDTPEPAPGEMVVNGDFSRDKLGWGPGGTIKSAGGNKYITNGYNWNVFQKLNLTPGEKYTVTADTKKASASTPARLSIGFYDSSGRQLDYVLVMYKHRGAGWESIPAKTFTVPEGTVTTKLFLMINGGSGVHAFDNVSVKRA